MEPPQDLRKALNDRKIPHERFVTMDIGETREFAECASETSVNNDVPKLWRDNAVFSLQYRQYS